MMPAIGSATLIRVSTRLSNERTPKRGEAKAMRRRIAFQSTSCEIHRGRLFRFAAALGVRTRPRVAFGRSGSTPAPAHRPASVDAGSSFAIFEGESKGFEKVNF